MTPKQRSLIDYNIGKVDISYDEKDTVFSMSRDENLHPQDIGDLCGMIWDLANKRDHEWLPNEKMKKFESLKLLLSAYRKKHPFESDEHWR